MEVDTLRRRRRLRTTSGHAATLANSRTQLNLPLNADRAACTAQLAAHCPALGPSGLSLRVGQKRRERERKWRRGNEFDFGGHVKGICILKLLWYYSSSSSSLLLLLLLSCFERGFDLNPAFVVAFECGAFESVALASCVSCVCVRCICDQFCCFERRDIVKTC